MTDGSAQTKAALRAHHRAARRSLDPAARRSADAAAQAHLLASPAYLAAAQVALYRPFDGEVATDAIAAAAARAGKRVLYARFAPGRPLTFVEPHDWRPTAVGALQPVGPARPLGPGDLIVVPGVAFDDDGYRLGLGGGHYDRTLATCPATAVGLAYEIQRVERLPRAPWDRPVAALATERGLYTYDEPENRT